MQEVTNYSVNLKKSHKIEIENMNTGERLQEFTTSFSPESSMFPPNKEIIRIYFTPSNFNLMVPADKPIRQVKPVDSVKTFHIRPINFENDDFNESQQNFLINLINNAFIAGEKNNTLFNKALPSWGSPTDYYTIPYVPGNSMDDPDIDHVLDFNISTAQEHRLIKINFEMGGREEPNLLVPARFPTEIEFDAHSFQMGELYEPRHY